MGALLALLIFHTELSIIALIGIILLIGIVKKNAILMIDFAIDAERNEGNSPEESIYQACLLRFRPIMMTTMAAMFGGIPIALGGGNGSELRRPLGIADRRRPDGQPDAHAVHHSGRLSLYGPLPRLGQRPPDPRPSRTRHHCRRPGHFSCRRSAAPRVAAPAAARLAEHSSAD